VAAFTPSYGLGLADPSVSDKTLAINALAEDLEAQFGGSVKSRSTGVPPASPAQGDRYIVPAGASGAWANLTGYVVRWRGTGWRFYPPVIGMRFLVEDEGYAYAFWKQTTGTWVLLSAGGGAGITAVIQDASPVLGGDLGGGNHRIGNVRGQSVEFDSATALAATGLIPGYLYKYVGGAETQVTLPLNAVEDTVCTFAVRTTGDLLFGVENAALMDLVNVAGQYRLAGRGAVGTAWCTNRVDDPQGNPQFVEWTLTGATSA
jgi:hypothetical protein